MFEVDVAGWLLEGVVASEVIDFGFFREGGFEGGS